MKTILLLIICAISLMPCSTLDKYAGKIKVIAIPRIDTINFITQLQPILQKNCSPCHFIGGKMYEKMPFDQGETIISHEACISKRFKNENELTILKQFIQQNKIVSKPH